MYRFSLLTLACCVALPLVHSQPLECNADDAPKGGATLLNESEFRVRFAEQQFAPEGGFLLKLGQQLPELVWEDPELVAKVVNDPMIPTKWFNERFEEVQTADKAGRYYAYGEAPVPSGPPLRRAMTCCCLADGVDLTALAKKRIGSTQRGAAADSQQIKAMILRWRSLEEGAVELASILESDQATGPVREGQWQMENATQHVRLKRNLMGLDSKPIVRATIRPNQGKPAPELRKGPLKRAGPGSGNRSEARRVVCQLSRTDVRSDRPKRRHRRGEGVWQGQRGAGHDRHSDAIRLGHEAAHRTATRDVCRSRIY